MFPSRYLPTRYFPRRYFPEVGASSPVSSINPSRYAIELRDKEFNLKARIEHCVTAVSWEWNRIGGCGRCTLKVDGDYVRFQVSADDDIRIYLPNSTSGATLWYRGYVESVAPNIQSGNDGSISIECSGYFGWLDRIVVNDSGSEKAYSNTEVSMIVQDIVDSFIVANSDITRGTIEAGTFIPDTLNFKSTAKDAIRTLYDLIGTIECGVDANLEFFWYNQNTDLSHVFYLGDKIVKITDRVDYRQIVNKIFFEGGDVGGGAYIISGLSQSSINRYGRHEQIVSNGSISTSSVASEYISSLLRQSSSPKRQLAISLKNTKKRFEATLPMGAVSVVDPDTNQTGAIYGTVGAGGSGKIYGRATTGGSGQVYGGVARHQIDRVLYTLSPQDGRIHADVNFGGSVWSSMASATLKRIENLQNALRQRTL